MNSLNIKGVNYSYFHIVNLNKILSLTKEVEANKY